MRTTEILKQAWQNVRQYRALWLFGIVLALVTASWGSAFFVSPDDGEIEYDRGITIQREDNETFRQAWKRAWKQAFDEENVRLNRALEELLEPWNVQTNVDLEKVLITGAAVIVSLWILAAALRYMSRVALIRMVDHQDETGEKQSVRQGLKLAWSRSAWQLFFIELLANLVGIAAVTLVFVLIFSPLPLWVDGSEEIVFAGSIITGALFFIAIFATIMASMAITLVKLFARRACALEGLGVAASLHRGYKMVRRHFRELLPMGLVGLAINLSWPTVVGCFLILLFGVGILLGGLPALAAGKLIALASAGDTAIFVALGLGLLILGAVLAAPLVWLDGMRQVFLSSIWTLSFRELREMESTADESATVQPRPRAQVIAQNASGLAR